jgi:hypothetical protein
MACQSLNMINYIFGKQEYYSWVTIPLLEADIGGTMSPLDSLEMGGIVLYIGVFDMGGLTPPLYISNVGV